MQANIIRNEKIQKHNVEPYHFKVLSSEIIHKEEIKEEPQVKVSPTEDNEQNQEEGVEFQSTPLVQPETNIPPSSLQDGFVETLLKKTDELSSNIIKLQMKIESQEEEFEKRLGEETLRAREEGLKEGYEKAKAEYEENLKELQTQYGRSIGLLEEECKNFQDFTEKTKNELSSTAIEVAKEVIQKEVSMESSTIASNLANALMDELDSQSKISIKVNVEDFDKLKEEFSSYENVQVLSDDAISKGGVIILSDKGNLDGNLNTRLEKIVQMMGE